MEESNNLNYPIYNSDGFIICQECGSALKRITPLHLQKHGISLQEYNDKYNYPPIVKLKDAKTIDDYNYTEVIQENDTYEDDRYKNLPPQKKSILYILEEYLNNIQPNYLVRLYGDPGKKFLEHEFITDIADPNKKIAFFFPDVFWRNGEVVQHPNKYQIMEDYGWKVFVIRGTNVVEGVRNILDSI